MPSKGTPLRSVRIPDDVWMPALATARKRGESLSDVVRRALTEYVTPRPPQERRVETRQ